MKPDYTLLKRSKINPDHFAFVYDGDLLAEFTPSKLYGAFEKAHKSPDVKEVDVLWRDGTRTVEHLVVQRVRKFVSMDTIMNYYSVCLMLRAQGAAVSLSVPVDVRNMFDAEGPMISEIRIDCDIVADLVRELKAVVVECADSNMEDDEWDDEDEDEDFDDEFHDLETVDPATDRMMISSWGYRAEDWAVTLTDEEVSEVHSLEVGVDPDIELPLAPDAKDKYF